MRPNTEKSAKAGKVCECIFAVRLEERNRGCRRANAAAERFGMVFVV
jgi:hypothetical protein